MQPRNGGLYSADELETGTYEITTGPLIYWTYEKEAVIVRQQETSTVPIIRLNPKYGKSIIYGKAEYSDGSVYANKELSWEQRSFMNPDTDATITTSAEGDYAFNFYSDAYNMSSPEGDVIIEGIRPSNDPGWNFWSGGLGGFVEAKVIIKL